MTAEISTPDSNPNDELVDAELSRLANGIQEQHRLAEEKVASGLMHALNAGTMLAQAKELKKAHQANLGKPILLR